MLCGSATACIGSVQIWFCAVMRGWLWKGLAWRSPFHRKRKPSMGLSFQIYPLPGSSGYRERIVFLRIGQCYICVKKCVKRWITRGSSLISFYISVPIRQRNHELFVSGTPKKRQRNHEIIFPKKSKKSVSKTTNKSFPSTKPRK